MSAHHAPNDRIAGYQLLSIIGSGSCGVVWLARSDSGVLRALKIVGDRDQISDSMLEREFRGVKHFAALAPKNDCLVEVLHVEFDTEHRQLVYVMQLADSIDDPIALSGPPAPSPQSGALGYQASTLKSLWQMGVHLSGEACLALALRVAEGLETLHRNNLVHRDVKPSNIIFVNSQARLADIGFVSLLGEAKSVVGTPAYFPAEGGGTAAGDLYAAGKVIYEAISRRAVADFPQIPNDLAIRPDRLLALELIEIAGRAAAARVADRYPDASTLLRDLRLVAAGGSVRTLRRNERWLRGFRRAAIAAALVALLLAIILVREIRQGRRIARVEAESRSRLVQLHISNGTRVMEDGNLPWAALWFVEALKIARDPREEEMLRWRLGAVMALSPQVVAVGVHEGPISEVAFSPDGSLVLSASEDRTARLWRSDTGALVGLPMRHEGAVNEAFFSPDGALVLTAGEDGVARLWSATNGEPTGLVFRHGSEIVHTEFSPDGKRLLTAGKNGLCRVWWTANGREVCPPLNQGGEIQWAAFSPDGAKIASASHNKTTCLWDALTGRGLTEPMTLPDMVEFVAFSPDGHRFVTACNDGIAQVWDSLTGEPCGATIHHLKLDYAAFSSDGTCILTSGGQNGEPGEARVWDAENGKPVSLPIRHANRVRYATFSPDGSWVASASHDGIVQIVDAKKGGPGTKLPHGNSIWSLSFSPDGKRLLTGGREGIWRVWDISRIRDPVRSLAGEKNYWMAQLSGDNQFLWIGGYLHGLSRLRVYSLPNLEERGVFLSDEISKYLKSEWNRSNSLVFGLATENFAIRKPSLTGYQMPFGESNLLSKPKVSFAWPAWMGVLQKDNELFLFPHDPSTNRGVSLALAGVPTKVVISGDRTRMAIATASPDISHQDCLELWNIENGRRLGRSGNIGREVTSLAFSPNGQVLAVALSGADDGTRSVVQIYDGWNLGLLGPIFTHPSGAGCPAFSPDGKWLATATVEGLAFVWDSQTGKLLYGPYRHDRGVSKLAFSPEGSRLAIGDWDGVVRVWEVKTGLLLTPPMRHEGSIISVHFDNQGEKLITVSYEGGPKVWSLPKLRESVPEIEDMAVISAGARLDAKAEMQMLSRGEIAAMLAKKGVKP